MLEYQSHTKSGKGFGLFIYGMICILCAAVGISVTTNMKVIFMIGSLTLLAVLLYLFIKGVGNTEDKVLIGMVVFALAIRIMIAIFLHYSSLFIEESDALRYHNEASRIASALMNGGSLTTRVDAFGYVFFGAFIYAGLDAISLILKIINCFVGAAYGLFAYMIAYTVWKDRRAALTAAALTLFLPGILVWSTLNAKDPWANLFILIIMWRFVQMRERGTKKEDLLIIAISMGALWTLRFYMVLIMTPVLIYAMGAGRRKSVVYLSILMLGAVLVFNYAFVGKEVRGVSVTFEELDARLYGFSVLGGSATGAYRDISTPGGAIAFMPLGVLIFLFSPFPWNEPTSSIYAFAIVEMLFVYILWPFIIMGIWNAVKRRVRGADVLLAYMIMATLIYALNAGNIGTFYRMRTPIMIFLIVFAAGGLLKAFKQKTRLGEDALRTASRGL